jgi:hypothetical protein
MKFGIGESHKNLSIHSYFGWNRTRVMGTLHEVLHKFLLVRVPRAQVTAGIFIGVKHISNRSCKEK